MFVAYNANKHKDFLMTAEQIKFEKQRADKDFEIRKRMYAEFVEPDPNNKDNFIYTGKHILTVPRRKITKPAMNPNENYFSGFSDFNCGFLRALADKQGNILAYTRAMQIRPGLLPGTCRVGTWYAFEEYNADLLGNFKIKILGHPADTYMSTWTYDADKRNYQLVTPGHFLADPEYFFWVKDTHIVTDYDELDLRYEYNVKQTKPNFRIVMGIRAAMHRNGILPCPAPLLDNFFPFLVREEEMRAKQRQN